MIDLSKPLFGELENMDEAFWDDPQCKGHLFHLGISCLYVYQSFAHVVDGILLTMLIVLE